MYDMALAALRVMLDVVNDMTAPAAVADYVTTMPALLDVVTAASGASLAVAMAGRASAPPEHLEIGVDVVGGNEGVLIHRVEPHQLLD